MVTSVEQPLRPIVDAWFGKIDNAAQDKHDKFGKFAEEGQRFYDAGHSAMWGKKHRTGAQGFLGPVQWLRSRRFGVRDARPRQAGLGGASPGRGHVKPPAAGRR